MSEWRFFCEAKAPMTAVHLLIWFFMVLLGASAVLALVWAVRSGQLARFQAGATSIFDEDEPIGCPTDAFPQRETPMNLNKPKD